MSSVVTVCDHTSGMFMIVDPSGFTGMSLMPDTMD